MSGGLRRDSRLDVVYRHKEPHHSSGSRSIRSQQIAHENRTSKATRHNRQSELSLVSHESKAESQARSRAEEQAELPIQFYACLDQTLEIARSSTH
jgi:hypothetical protein